MLEYISKSLDALIHPRARAEVHERERILKLENQKQAKIDADCSTAGSYVGKKVLQLFYDRAKIIAIYFLTQASTGTVPVNGLQFPLSIRLDDGNYASGTFAIIGPQIDQKTHTIAGIELTIQGDQPDTMRTMRYHIQPQPTPPDQKSLDCNPLSFTTTALAGDTQAPRQFSEYDAQFLNLTWQEIQDRTGVMDDNRGGDSYDTFRLDQ